MTKSNWPESKRRFLYAVAAAASVGVLLFAFSPGVSGGPAIGAPAPDFALTDLGGRTETLSARKGEVVLLDFWATWCVSCEQEVPELKAIHRDFKDRGFSLLAIACDEGGPETVARFVADYQLPYPVLYADKDTISNYRIFGLPTKFLIDAEGKVFRKYLANASHTEIASDIETLLNRSPS